MTYYQLSVERYENGNLYSKGLEYLKSELPITYLEILEDRRKLSKLTKLFITDIKKISEEYYYELVGQPETVV